MSHDNGANPMRWDCQRQGCFNAKKRPKIEQFADCLPGRIAFTDVDGLVEINGNLLLIEWKDHQSVSTGQRILFERLTRFSPAVVLIVEGDAETMAVESIAIAYDGRIDPPAQADLDGLRKLIREWAQWALGNSVVRRLPSPETADEENRQ
ncbi:MAG TPA: hypothetical protein VE890_13060 [Thermoguttaceae bacterium]|nr:hypothetical protein [Thermoguttaceae bacterium]